MRLKIKQTFFDFPHILKNNLFNFKTKRDEYIDLQKNFLFMGHDLLVGVSIGNIQDIRPMIAHRMIRTNFSGLRVMLFYKL